MPPKLRAPTPPGEMLLEEFLKPAGLTQSALAAQLGVPVQRINLIVRGRRAITAETALMLADAFKNTPEFWMNLQTAHDLWHAREALKKKAG